MDFNGANNRGSTVMLGRQVYYHDPYVYSIRVLALELCIFSIVGLHDFSMREHVTVFPPNRVGWAGSDWGTCGCGNRTT